jgi:glycosyltransferase 2 family protein
MRDRTELWSKLWTFGTRYLASESGRQAVSAILFFSALAFIGFFVVREWDALISFPWQLRLGSLAGMIVMHSLALGSLFLAWHLMMRHLTDLSDWRYDLQIYSLSILSRRIPTPLWYIGSRLYLYRRQCVPASAVLSATGMEMVLIGLNGAFCYVLLLPWYTYTQQWPWQAFLVAWAILVIALVLRPNLLIDFSNWILCLLGRPLLDTSITRVDLVLWTLTYLTTWFFDGIGLHCLISAILPTSLGLADTIGISTLSALVGLSALGLPAGLGLKELTMGTLLSLWIPVSAGIGVSILYRLMQTLVEGTWALISYWIGQRFWVDEYK